jgi:hypothetical protein
MSSYSIVQDTTRALRRLIYDALDTAPDTDFGMTAPEADITMVRPGGTVQGTPKVSLFLHCLRPDAHLRNQNMLPAGDSGLRIPPMALELHYLVTPLADDEDDNQLMLGRVLQHFHDAPYLDELDAGPLDDSFGGGSTALRIALEPLTTGELYEVWSALDTPYRLSVSYLVRTVCIDSSRGQTAANRVVEAHTVVGRAVR